MVSTVGVLRGGKSYEHQASLKVGESVLRCLPKEKYKTVDILLTKDSIFHEDGFPKPLDKILQKVDVVFNALAGGEGEDGKIQQILEGRGVPYTGSGPLASTVATKKHLAKQIFEQSNIKTPRSVFVRDHAESETKAHEAFQSFLPYWMVKPASLGSGIGVTLAKSHGGILDALSRAFYFDKSALIEEQIQGREFIAGVMENFRGKKYYALPLVEKIRGREICPTKIDLEIGREIQNTATRAHEALGLSGYSSSDIIAGKRGVFLLETDSLPHLLPGVGIARAAEEVGLEYPQFLDLIVTMSARRAFQFV